LSTRSWWGWGDEERALRGAELTGLSTMVSERFGRQLRPVAPVPLSELRLPVPRVQPPQTLIDIASDSLRDRASHAYGSSYRDVIRAARGDIGHPPDQVLRPRGEPEVIAVLDWAAATGVAVVPYGGGSSVVGGVELREQRAWISLDTGRLDQLAEVDRTSRAARVQAGMLGPALEDALRPMDLTLRFFPQSFEFSTVGGWIATRAAGHFATGPTHIDDLVESVRMITPAGPLESRRLPASGAGPAPDRLLLGSEGSFGVVTEAWLRLQDRPRWRGSCDVRFASFSAGAQAVRVLLQSGLLPANCRLLDPGEAQLAGGDGTAALLVVGFESAHLPVDSALAAAIEICQGAGGTPGQQRTSGPGTTGERPAGAGAWRSSFLRAPYLRDALALMSVIVETFETACTWADLPALHVAVTERIGRELAAICGGGTVTCRLTHAYPDGCAPYFSVIAPSRPGSELAQWDALKAAATAVILDCGGTVTHHHAVGRDHRSGYDLQRPALFAQALGAIKGTLDPAGVMNPGVLLG